MGTKSDKILGSQLCQFREKILTFEKLYLSSSSGSESAEEVHVSHFCFLCIGIFESYRGSRCLSLAFASCLMPPSLKITVASCCSKGVQFPLCPVISIVLERVGMMLKIKCNKVTAIENLYDMQGG